MYIGYHKADSFSSRFDYTQKPLLISVKVYSLTKWIKYTIMFINHSINLSRSAEYRKGVIV